MTDFRWNLCRQRFALALLLWPGAVFAAPPPVVIVLDPGHGGEDLGAVVRKEHEKDIDLAIAEKLKSHIDRMPGFSARLTRQEDELVPRSERVELAEAWGGRAFLSLHADQVHRPSGRGIVVYVYGKNRLIPKGHVRAAEKPLPPPPKKMIKAARALSRSIRRELKRRGFSSDEDHGAFLVLKSSVMPSVLIEMGNLSDRREAHEVAEPEFQDRIAEALAAGVAGYFDPKRR